MASRLVLFLTLIVASGCSGPSLPFERDATLGSGDASLVRPPWEALVEAGPGADQELDMETLDGPAPTPVIAADVLPAPQTNEPEVAVAPQVTPKPPRTKSKDAVVIEAVAVPNVTGAKGSGSADLTRAMRMVLKEAGWPVVNVKAANALTIEGRVKQGPVEGASEQVQLEWLVRTPDGKILGNVAQTNTVPAGSLNNGWGENARFAAEAAADGIFKLIQKYR
jgi:hypothetical protein